MASKPKLPQKENLTEVSGRDQFQTPNYAVDLLIPFIPFPAWKKVEVWECAAGLKKIVNRLHQAGYDVTATDLAWEDSFNFITDRATFFFDCIITNPPFSLKEKFYRKCRKYGTPFALLVPADYSKWTIEAVEKDGAEKIVPNRRVDYITPDILQRIHEGEMWKMSGITTCTMKEYKEIHPDGWKVLLEATSDRFLFQSIYDAPSTLLKKYSSSQFHSMWLTWGFNIGRTETFVELSNAEKLNI